MAKNSLYQLCKSICCLSYLGITKFVPYLFVKRNSGFQLLIHNIGDDILEINRYQLQIADL